MAIGQQVVDQQAWIQMDVPTLTCYMGMETVWSQQTEGQQAPKSLYTGFAVSRFQTSRLSFFGFRIVVGKFQTSGPWHPEQTGGISSANNV